MKFDRTGFILYTLNYEACIAFYAQVLELKILFTTETLTCFSFGASYLMVEIDDEYDRTEPPPVERTRTCLRMHVPDVRPLVRRLRAHQIAVNYQEHPWGTIAKFVDPDGNLCAFRDSATFEVQVAEGGK